MTESQPKRRRVPRWLQAVIGIAVLLLFVIAGWYLTSPGFHEYVRKRVVANLESVTGGRVELKSLTWNLSRLEFDIRDLTIHGKEGPGEPPYAHIDRLRGRAKIISLFRREIGLRALAIERPVIHLIVYPDGTTNQPAPRRSSSKSAIAQVFDLAFDHAEVSGGELLVNDHPVPLDFSADGISAGLTYDAAGKWYDGSVKVDKVDGRYRDWLPVGSALEAQFRVWPTRAELKTLRWSSGNSVVEASGRMSDFSNPTLELTYKARVDLAQLSATAHVPRLRGGVLEINGQGTYTAANFFSAGNLALRNLDYRDPAIRVRNANIGASYSVTKDRLLLPHLFANIFGGTVVGDADVHNWSDFLVAGTPVRELQQGTAHLRIENVPVQAMADAVSSRELPLDRLKLAGRTGGNVNASWKGAIGNLQAAIIATVVPSATLAPDQMPVSARLQADYFGASGDLRVEHLALTTRATRLVASGMLGPGSENLKLTATTTNLSELQPLLDAFHGPKQIPVELRGPATFTGTAIGKLSALTIAGHLQASDFDTLLAYSPQPMGVLSGVPAPPATAPHRAHWDSFSADILYSPRMLAARNAVLRSGRAQLNFDGSIGLDHGAAGPNSPVSAHLLVHDGDIADLQALAGYQYPLSGTVNANLAITGTQGDPNGGGRLVLANGSVYGEPVTALAADFLFAHHQVQANNINLVHNGARITGTAGYNLSTAAYRFDLRGTNFNLARVQRLQTRRLSLAGILNFTARGSGIRNEPTINASVQMSSLVLNGEKVGDFTADASTTGSEMRIAGRSNFENADLRVDGTVQLRGDLPANLNLNFTHLDFDPLIRAFLKGQITGHSSSAGNIEVQGPLRRPRELSVTGAIDQLSANLENINIQNEGPIRFTVAQETLRLEQLRLTGEDTSVNASGTVQLGAQKRLDLQSDGHVNLRLLQSFYPDLVSSGTVTFGVNLTGPIANPQVQGQMQIADGAISYTDLPNGLSGLNGTLMFNRDRVVVQSMTARTGGGTLNIGGFVTYGRTLTFNLTATGRDVRLRYPAGVSSMANANLSLTGSLQNSTLAGDIVVTKFGMTPQFDFATYVARSKQPPEVPNPKSPLNNVHLDVHITSTPELQVQTSLAKVSGDVDLRVRGLATRPVVLGKVNIIEGDVFLNGTKYHMERGDITFSNPVRIEPVLDIEATARVKEYDVTLGFHGPLDRLATTYRSDPPLPTADIIALLALGHTREETAMQQQPQTSFTEAASYAILGQAINAAVSSRVQRIFGVSRIKIDPQATNATGTTQGGPQLSIEQQVNNNITLTYVTNLSQGNQQTIQLQYDINRNVSIIAIRDDLTGVISFDVKIRQRKK